MTWSLGLCVEGGRKTGAAAVLIFTFSLLVVSLTFLPTASGQSARCPNDFLEDGNADPLEASMIVAFWKEVHGPGLSGGDGPLGCPVGKSVKIDNTEYSWKGVKQTFQRGWIFLGRGTSAGGAIVVVRGLDSWTIWWKGVPSEVLPMIWNEPIEGTRIGHTIRGTPAWWRYGGDLYDTYAKDNKLSFALADLNELPARPFDPAAKLGGLVKDQEDSSRSHLDAKGLTKPDISGLDKRINALFTDWLPCHTRLPKQNEPDKDDIGESTFANAMIMMRRSAPCPLTGRSPSADVKDWLRILRFPADMVPGTSWDEKFPCSLRKGELDVTLVQLLYLRLKHGLALADPIRQHIDTVLSPWGTPARKTPYVTPQGTCGGFSLIETENHMLLQETAAYLINSLMGRDTASNRDWIMKFLTQIIRRDFYEFNSIPYSRYQLKALYVLHDYAPHEHVRTVAAGVLDWIFAKQAVSGNLDRDHRPYRRTHGDAHLAPSEWWGSAATPITTETAVLAGPLQHSHTDIDLEFEQETSKQAWTDVTAFPNLGTVHEYSAAALVDVAHTNYRLPEALVGWIEWRYTSEESNRTTYIQAINHVPKIIDDTAIFAQANSGAEMVSGNRNWTMIAGGTPSPPGDPGPPPLTNSAEAAYTAGVSTGGAVVGGTIGGVPGAVVGGVIGGILGGSKPEDIAADKQRDFLWGTQAGTIRETTLIPTPVGLDRNHTFRFGASVVTTGGSQVDRLCIAEGFMCGYDLKWPIRPFPDAKDAFKCPLDIPIPPWLTSAFQSRVGGGKTVISVMGCPLTEGSNSGWSIWTFENGMLAVVHSDPAGEERFAGAWVEGRTDEARGHMRVSWNIRGDGYDWFRVHAYRRSVSPRGGEPPGGWIDPLPIVGNPSDRTMQPDGEATFPISADVMDLSWDVLIVGCKKEYFAGVLTGHDCKDNKMPRLTVNVGPMPKQSFSCAVHVPPPPRVGKKHTRHERAVIMEVGSCKDGPYGLYVYPWNEPCPYEHERLPGKAVSFPGVTVCPEGASNYGFVVVAPSRGMTPDEFRNIVGASMANWRAGGNNYAPGLPASIDVPISPPVVRKTDMNLTGGTKWMPTAPPSRHTVTFRWPVVGGAAILGDTGAPSLFFPTALGVFYKDWPTALGHVSAPDSPGAADTLIRNSGTGCFTVSGFPTPHNSNPKGLLVDFRNIDIAAPIVADLPSLDLPSRCP